MNQSEEEAKPDEEKIPETELTLENGGNSRPNSASPPATAPPTNTQHQISISVPAISSQPRRPPARTYSTYSMPFLAGGELKLPNIFSAVLTCGKHLADSVKNWKKEDDDSYKENSKYSLISMTPKHDLENQLESIIPKESTRLLNSARNTNFVQTDLPISSTTTKVIVESQPSTEIFPTEPANEPKSEAYVNAENCEQASQKPMFQGRAANFDMNLQELKRNSKPDVPEGVEGLIKLCRGRNKNSRRLTGKAPDFIGSFVEKNCVEFIEALDTIENYFLKRVPLAMFSAPQTRTEQFSKLLKKIMDLKIITPAEKEKELQDYNFPLVLQHDLLKFNIDVSEKLDAMREMHNYGVKMILHWIYTLQDRVPISPETVTAVGTELLSSVVIISYAIFAEIGAHLAALIEDSVENLNHPPVEQLIQDLRNLMDTISDELGAVGESGAQILIRTLAVTSEYVENVLRDLYMQVNYAEIALSRAMEALIPVVQCYAIDLLRRNKTENTSQN